jgi:DNA-binding response OmpR family regulator
MMKGTEPDTILIVDDDPAILLLIKSILADQGFRLLTAADGRQAQSIIEEKGGEITLLVLDWEMPKMTGIDLLRWLKEQREYERTPVVMQTAKEDPESVREGIEAGAYYYLTKPFNRDVLLSIVQAAVADVHARHDLLTRLKQSENPYDILVDGLFQFKTLHDGELLSARIANASPEPQKVMIISELMRNAVEHGNLGITYDEKTAILAEGDLSKEIERRLRLPEYAERVVRVQFRKLPTKLTVTIEDQGEGFDFAKYLGFDETRVFDSHGRGIAMTACELDVQYQGKGNSVMVTIPIAS